MAKRATFQDAQTVRRARAARRQTAQALPPERTVAQHYADLAGQVDGLMKQLATTLAAHQNRHAADPSNWGHVGDLNRVWGHLADAVGAIR